MVLGFQLFRFALLPFMGLMPQDAYYHFYGEHLALSYFDHPGMIGYILRGFTSVFGKTVWVIKLADFTVSSLTLLSFYQLSEKFLSKGKAQRAIVLLSSTICISILSFNSTPDVPLMLFWTLSVFALYKAIFEKNTRYWIFAGITMGLAFDSKYTALLLPIGLLGFLLFSKTYRSLFISPWLWVCLLVTALVTTPVWWWNYQHDFASFLFQSSHRTGTISKFQISPNYFFGAIGHQMLLLLPVLLLLFIRVSYAYCKKIVFKRQLPSDTTLFLLAFFIPTFLGFFLLSPIYWIKLNWLMPSYITGVVLVSMFTSKKMLKTQVAFSIVFHLLFSLQILFYLVPIKSDDTWEGWEELADATTQLQETYPKTFVFSNDNYKTSAALNFFLEQKVYAQNIVGLPALQFDYIGDDLRLLTGRSALFIDSDKRFKNRNKKEKTPEILTDYFVKVTQLPPIIIQRKGKEIRKFWVFYCEEYQAKK